MANKKTKPVVTTPAGSDKNWHTKVAAAKAAREQGKSLREGKPTSFRSAVGRSN